MYITIRKAKLKDLPEIIKLASDAINYSISPFRSITKEKAREYRKNDLKDLEQWLSPDSPGSIFVARTEYGEICGHIILVMGSFDIIGEKLGWVLDITVSSEFRGTGISQKLHELAEIILKGKKIKGLCLSVTSSNKRAVEFYNKLGYKEEHLHLVKMLE